MWRIGGLLTGDETDADAADLDAVLDIDWLPVQGEDDTQRVDNPQSVAASLARIDQFLGSEWWREVFSDARTKARGQGERAASARAAQEVAKEYCRRIEADTGYQAFPVPIRREPGQEPLFMMILFYRCPGAPYVFNEAVPGTSMLHGRSPLARESTAAKMRSRYG
ncbi:hypothetical protein [Lentzea jiangxiensis]|uniref:Uncharacterized protein n=1 Tax=Lentzea jiangxiensis TaxID=641025 RepID=A0A1H0X6E5_9PSEU|nr:hypothetical protein [Lentzea jiangxiensis]SDP98472.1 hypothetical protein SAMN05421507_1404 [Lentzea jiangxiensis]